MGSLSSCLTHQALNVDLVLYHKQWLHVKPGPLTWADAMNMVSKRLSPAGYEQDPCRRMATVNAEAGSTSQHEVISGSYYPVSSMPGQALTHFHQSFVKVNIGGPHRGTVNY